LKTAAENIDKLNRDIADYKTDLAKTKIKYDLGLISKLDYDKKEVGLSTMENSLNSAIADQNSLYANLMLYVDPTTETTK
jgi:outer membrane protein TolC